MTESHGNANQAGDSAACRVCGRPVPDGAGSTCTACAAASGRDDQSHDTRAQRRFSWFWAVMVAGTVIRIVAILLSSPEYNLPFWKTYGWPADHATYVRWARQATSPDYGLLSMYTVPPESGLNVRLSYGRGFVHHGEGDLANYPPLGLYMIWLQGMVHHALDPDRVANTALARAVFDSLPAFGDIILAIGVWMLCTTVFDRRVAAVATSVVYLIPPIWLDSCWWGQTDSWELAPMVWILWAMARRRWLTAGVMWGIALSLKPQAVLFAPLWAFVWLHAVLSRRSKGPAGDRSDRPVRIVAAVLLAIVVLNVTALPFWFSSGAAWLEQSYLRNLRDEQPFTTLKAFNIWYVDLLCSFDANSTTPLLGVAKETWGKLLAVAGLLVSGLIAWRRQENLAGRLVLFAGLWLLAVVMLPTRVHERYILMCLPPLVIAAAAWRRLWPGVAGVIVVACFQLTVYHWLPLPADSWTRKWLDDTVLHHEKVLAETPPEYRDQLPTREQAIQIRFRLFRKEHAKFAPCEWALTIVSCLAAAHVFLAASSVRPMAINKSEPQASACADA